MLGRDARQGAADHASGRGVDRRFADRQGEAGERDRADSGARPEEDAGPLGSLLHGREHERAVGDVGVVARVLHDAGGRLLAVEALEGERELHAPPGRELDRNGIGKSAGEERLVGRGRRRGGARTGGPAAAQGWLAHLEAA